VSQRELLDVESTAGHLLRPGSVFGWLAAYRRELFPDEMFADLFPSGRGRSSVPADVMATLITLQALHRLSDAETVDAVTYDLRWKAACGLAVTAMAFHPTTPDLLAASVGRVEGTEADLSRGSARDRRDGGAAG